jgi:hypothetical protein
MNSAESGVHFRWRIPQTRGHAEEKRDNHRMDKDVIGISEPEAASDFAA